VTDPRVTRYFMTIREAVQLVIQAGAIGGGGDVLVLDMGEPVPIRQMAQQLIDLSGQRVEITYTGLREGEKLHEELFGDGEDDIRPHHPLISHAAVPAYAAAQAAALDPYASPEAITARLAGGCRAMGASHLVELPVRAQRVDIDDLLVSTGTRALSVG
jgi:FlaA1/EpsC-like NDP-sugar epimerase